MARARIERLVLTDFRSYRRGELVAGGRTTALFGPNGAGKTNLLEALSLLSPGRGLRHAALPELGRREPGEAQGRAWAAAVDLTDEAGEPVHLGTGVEAPGAARRLVRIEGETVPPARLLDHLRLVWLTPREDRLFLEAASERRRFFDRLVFAGEPGHATEAAAYERALRERGRLLADDAIQPDPAWLTALEAQLATSGARIALARARTLAALRAEIDARGERPFPQARLALSGEWADMAERGASEAEIEAALAQALAAARPRDAAAGRALTGPHRADLLAWHAAVGRPAAECSTGEQKALLLNLILAQAARLSRADSAPNPILLLDEVAAHLDPLRRAALADEIATLGLQAFLTGTDAALFEPFAGRASHVRVEAAGLTLLDT